MPSATTPLTVDPEPGLRVLFTGDINPGRCPAQIALEADDFSLPYRAVTEALSAADLAVGSLDGSLSDIDVPAPCTPERVYNLIGPARTAEGLADSGQRRRGELLAEDRAVRRHARGRSVGQLGLAVLVVAQDQRGLGVGELDDVKPERGAGGGRQAGSQRPPHCLELVAGEVPAHPELEHAALAAGDEHQRRPSAGAHLGARAPRPHPVGGGGLGIGLSDGLGDDHDILLGSRHDQEQRAIERVLPSTGSGRPG